MENKFNYLEWQDNFLLDSEITLFINNNLRKNQEFYKIMSLNNNIQFNSLIKTQEEEKKVLVKIDSNEYKKIWDFYFLIKPYLLKNIYIYQSEEPISYLFSFRCFEQNKKITGLGKIIQKELSKIYDSFKKIHNRNLII